jgi:hypothetical protein
MGAVPKAVPSAVAPSASGNNVQILTSPQLGPYQPMSGSTINPVVPRTKEEGETRPQPHWTSGGGKRTQLNPDGHGAPSVPVDGYLFKAVPVDSHYLSQDEAYNPYKRVNSPPTRGMFTWVKGYLNHIAHSVQEVDLNGFRVRTAQQRTSFMRFAPPPHGIGYAPETAVPHQNPQHANIAKFLPATGTQAYGTGVLNSNTFGAGQTAGGVGGSQYTVKPGLSELPSIVTTPDPTGMPVWG